CYFRRRPSRVSPVVSLVFPALCALRPLHSFPTRRSSDLAGRSRQLALLRLIGASPARLRRAASAEGLLISIPSAEAARRSRAGEDRKSTRLNSSHVSISYAVFCLKKKKEMRASSITSTIR